MALQYEQLEAVTNDYYENRTTDIFFTENILLYKLMGSGNMEMNMVKGSEMADGGQSIRVFLEHAASNSGTYGNTTTIDMNKADIINAARFRWAGYYASNTIDLDEQRQNTGKAQMVDLVMAKMQSIEKTIRDTMGAAVYASAANNDAILGLGNLFSTVTSTAYGEIAEDDMALWKANNSAASAAMSYKLMQTLFRTAQVGQSSAARPNLVVTTNLLKDAYERVLQVQQRFADAKLVEAGFPNILHSGAPVVGDDNQSVGYVDALNLRYLSIKTHPAYNFTKPVWEKDRLTPDTLTANVRWSGQLVCTHRKAHARYTAVSDPA